jgi:hypothetical protein
MNMDYKEHQKRIENENRDKLARAINEDKELLALIAEGYSVFESMRILTERNDPKADKR